MTVVPMILAAAALVLPAPRPRGVRASQSDSSLRERGFLLPWGAALGVAALTWIVVGGVIGAAVGAVTGLMAAGAARRLDRAHGQDAQREAVTDLPLALELLDAAISAGQPPGRAADVVGRALGGAVGLRLQNVARVTALGADPEQAWSAFADLADEASPAARQMVRAVTRGTSVSTALGSLASELRGRHAERAEERVRRVAVLIVLPLGLCFLPAFICVGVFPMIIGTIGSVLHR